jgi:hypothetical protein
MKLQICVVLFALSMLSAGALGQCARPEMNPIWDTDKQQFRCVATKDSEAPSHDETVSPKGDKVFCNNARENLLKACPASNEGKTCKSKAKSIFQLLLQRCQGSKRESAWISGHLKSGDQN